MTLKWKDMNPEEKEKWRQYQREYNRRPEIIERRRLWNLNKKNQLKNEMKGGKNEMTFKPKNKVVGNIPLQNQIERPAVQYSREQQVPQLPQLPQLPQIPYEQSKKTTPRFIVAELVTETAPVIKDQISGDTYDIMSALIWVMNKLSDLEGE